MVFYFAYGSNMNQADLDEWCKKNGQPQINLRAKNPKQAILKEFALIFHYYSTTRKGGAADIVRKQGSYVEGVLFEMTEGDMRSIKSKEGAPKFYHEMPVSVVLADGTICNDVVTYVVVDERVLSEFVPPTKEYRDIMVSGACEFGLSSGWVNCLKNMPTKN